ncbi:MFS transporter [Paeniglutamicibacter sp.]|uniref:MFS transporter n=1 Tax=Paeniglutamicibacter sp. TaxID=1934391 RepID=UPI0039895DED
MPPGRLPTQRRVLTILVVGQILGGLGMGASLSLGALLAVHVSGSAAWSGMGATMNTLGAALFAIPLARLAMRRGRRVSLATGALISGIGACIVIPSAAVTSFAGLLVGLALLGAGTAVGLQSRFAANDLSSPKSRGRDISIVIWSTTIGAVAGPNLVGPGEAFGQMLHMPPLTGSFVITVLAQLLAALVYIAVLRPDPLGPRPVATTAGRRTSSGMAVLLRNPNARFAVAVIALSHGTMVALMSMTPVHLQDHGAGLTAIGLTISLHIAGMYALSPVFGWLADRIGRLPSLLMGQGMLLVSLLLAWLAPDTMTTPSLILLGLGWSASIISGSTFLTDSVPAGERPGVQGLSDLAMNLVGALCGALAGLVLSGIGYSGLAAVAMVLVGGVIGWTILRSTRIKSDRMDMSVPK